MTGIARLAPPFTRGIDALEPLTRDQLLSFKERYAITVVGAYVEVLAGRPEYRDLIFDLGLGIAPYSEASIGEVTGDMGSARGRQAAQLAQKVGVPTGCDLLIDLEDVTGDAIPEYVNNRSVAYEQVAGLGSLLYVGEPLPAAITAQVLQSLRPPRYMRSCSLGVPEPARKWCVLQHSPGNYLDPIANVRIDHFTVEQDAFGGLPTWWYPT